MRHCLFFLLLLSSSVLAEPVVVDANAIGRLESGAQVARDPVIAQIIDTFEQQADGAILIGHGTDEAGRRGAGDLRAWFVALGIASKRIQLRAQPDLQQVLTLEVMEYSSL